MPIHSTAPCRSAPAPGIPCSLVFLFIFLFSILVGTPAPADIGGGGEWLYDLHLGGARAGTCRITSRRPDGGRLETRAQISYDIRQSGEDITIVLDGRTVYEWPTGRPCRYRLDMSSTAGPSNRISGEFAEGRCAFTTLANGRSFPACIEIRGDEYILDNNFLLDHSMVMLSRSIPPVGQERTIRFVVPQLSARLPRVLTLSLRNAGLERIEAGGSVREALHLTARGETGLKMEFWLDPAERTLLRWRIPSRETDVILAGGESGGRETVPADMDRLLSRVVRQYYIPSGVALKKFRDLAELKIHLRLCLVTAGEQLPLWSSYQHYEGRTECGGSTACLDGVMETRMVVYGGEDALPLALAPQKYEMRYLGSSPDIPADSREVSRLAACIAEDSRTRWEAAAAIARWVRENIDYEITGSGALDCLQTRRGDCGPQSLLSLAMMRSLGIPARQVGGLLYVGGRLGQHHWLEVLVRPGRWIPMDPTTGEIGTFSAAHLTLWRGTGALAPHAEPMAVDVLAFRKTEPHEAITDLPAGSGTRADAGRRTDPLAAAEPVFPEKEETVPLSRKSGQASETVE